MTTTRLTALRAKYAHLADPGIAEFMALAEEVYPEDAIHSTFAEHRRYYDHYCARFRSPRPAGVKSMDFSIEEVPCRLYSQSTQSKTILLYIHGGGLILGNLDTHDDIAADLCAETGLEVIAIQYRLAPEHLFPAALDDCWAVLTHIMSEKKQVVISGNSSGASLAAGLCLRARDEGRTGIRGQVLIVPGLGGDPTRGSYITQVNAPGLSTADVIAYQTTNGTIGNKLRQPLHQTNFENLPPAFLVAAGLDPLHDDCFDYAAKLQAAGVATEIRDEPMLVHDFIRARYMSEPAKQSFKAIVAAITRFAA